MCHFQFTKESIRLLRVTGNEKKKRLLYRYRNLKHQKPSMVFQTTTVKYPSSVHLALNENEMSVNQSCLTLCNLMDCSLPGSSVNGIFQARILKWVAIRFSRESSKGSNQGINYSTGLLVSSFMKLFLNLKQFWKS